MSVEKLGLLGFQHHPWASVERTRRFYTRALSEQFTLHYFDRETSNSTLASCDAVLDFTGVRCWDLPERTFPFLCALHGGPIVDYHSIRQHLGKLRTHDTLIANCRSDISILKNILKQNSVNICRLPLPVDQEIFSPMSKVACREALSLENADYILGFVGRLLPQKNLHNFLHLVAKVRKALAPKLTAAIVVGEFWADYPILNYAGCGYPDYVRSLIDALDLSDNVAFFSKLNDDDLCCCYSAMDILVHLTNSIDENFGYVPIEAMACGTPVIGNAYGGLKDTINHGETGFLIPTWITASGIRSDAIQAVELIIATLKNQSLLSHLSHGALKHVSEHFSYEKCAPILRSAVEDAIRLSRGGESCPLSITTSEPLLVREPGFLPAIGNGWEKYEPAVKYYVSGQCPELLPSTRMQLAAPIEQVLDGVYRLDDPAWPATFNLAPEEVSIMEKCRTPVHVNELCQYIPTSILLKQLDAGLLIASNWNYDSSRMQSSGNASNAISPEQD